MKINLSFLGQEFIVDVKKTGEENIVETPFGEIKIKGKFEENTIIFELDDMEEKIYYYVDKENLYIHFRGKVWEFQRKERKFEEKERKDKFDGKIYPPMPGNVVKIFVKEGDEIEEGAPLLVLESMKMEHTINSPVKGRIKKIYALPQTVAELSKPLIELENF